MRPPITTYAMLLLGVVGLPLAMTIKVEPQVMEAQSGCAGDDPVPLIATQRSAVQSSCFSYLARYACGNGEGSWSEIKPGVIQCLTKHNRKTGKPLVLIEP